MHLRPNDKEIVLFVTPQDVSAGVLEAAKGIGIGRLLTRETALTLPVDGFSIVRISEKGGEGYASWVRITGGEDLQRAADAGLRGQSFVVVECPDWKIIPLENLVAEFRRRGLKLYAYAGSGEEVETAFTILEKGVDGVVVPPSSLPSLRRGANPSSKELPLVPSKVTRIVDAGVGDRACVDTTSQLEVGEGMLVGSKASFFFLVHGETIPSEYIPVRPFRVNAGALHGYILTPEGKTRYLSELEPPARVAIVHCSGTTREASVGRVKIERRPMVLVEASTGNESGTIILQRAETIRLVTKTGEAVAVTDLAPGDEVLVHTERARGRHFGGEVDEHVLEK